MENNIAFARSNRSLINLSNIDRVLLKDKRIFFYKFSGPDVGTVDMWEYPSAEEAQEDYEALTNQFVIFTSSITPNPSSGFGMPIR